MRRRYDMLDPRVGVKIASDLRKVDLDIKNLEIMIENTLLGNPIRQVYINQYFAKKRERNRLTNQLGGVATV